MRFDEKGGIIQASITKHYLSVVLPINSRSNRYTKYVTYCNK